MCCRGNVTRLLHSFITLGRELRVKTFSSAFPINTGFSETISLEDLYQTTLNWAYFG